MHLGVLAAALPLFAAAWQGRRYRAGVWVPLVSGLSLAGDALGLYLAVRGRNNHVLAYLLGPLFFAAMLMALAERQHRRDALVAIRIVAGLLLVASMILAFTSESLGNFSQFVIPLGALLVLGTAVWMLVQGGLGKGYHRLTGPDWFWIPAGFALYGAVTAAYFPLVAVFVENDRHLVDVVLQLKAVSVVIAFCLVAWGVLCQGRVAGSGRSSWSSSSPSPSS